MHILNDVDASEHQPQPIYKMIFMMADIRMVEEPEISGDVFVFDLANVSITIMLKHAGSLLKKALTLAQVRMRYYTLPGRRPGCGAESVHLTRGDQRPSAMP